jgi:hypothetical protein
VFASLTFFSASNPDTTLTRIGVYNPWGKFVSITAMLSTDLADEITALIDRGKAPTAVVPAFNAADLDAQTLSRVLGTDLTVSSTTTTVFQGSAQTTSSFRRDDKTIVVSIDVFDGFEEPMDALISHISGFQARPLDSVIDPVEPHLGAYSFRTRNGAFWLRGNMFIRVDHFSDQPVIEQPFDISLASNLDAHLGESPSVAPLPALDFEPPIPDTVRRGETLSVALRTSTDPFTAMTSVSNNVDVLVPRGPPDEDGHFVFYAQAVGTAKVVIAGAVRGSLRPIENSFEVRVEDTQVHHASTAIVIETGDHPGELTMGPAWPGE